MTELAPAQIFLDGKVELRPGDCRDVIRDMPDNSVDSVVTDPPYALVSIVKRFGGPNAAPAKGNEAYMRASGGFMNKTWDSGETAFAETFWREVLRILKPGGHVVAFSGTRTYHRMAVAIEDAGFEIRDQLAWMYGSGFPKSHDVSKGIDKARRRDYAFAAVKMGLEVPSCSMGDWTKREHSPSDAWWERFKEVLTPDQWGEIERAVVGTSDNVLRSKKSTSVNFEVNKGSANITAPATDAARKWQGWGTALKPAWEPICLARKPLTGTVAANVLDHGTGALNIDGCRVGEPIEQTPGGLHRGSGTTVGSFTGTTDFDKPQQGRWPANIVHDGSDEVVAGFPSESKSGGNVISPPSPKTAGIYGSFARDGQRFHGHNDSGSAARFFYTAKADKLDRIGSKHPTVKPVDLMQWLCRMVTPPGGVVLDPFAGSGSTGEAAWREGFRCILIEREEEYQADIAERLRLADKGPATRKARAIKQAANDNDLPLFAPATPVAGAA